jgi:phosphatidylglycerophosphatase A
MAFVAGIWICEKVSRHMGVHDHGGIVWDEMTGIWLVMVAIPADWYWPIVGFVLFRILDIVKPWPISWIDSRVKGGFGIMLDDIVAAAAAWLIIQLTYEYLQNGNMPW